MKKIKQVLEIAWHIRIHCNIESSLRQCSYLNFLLVLIFSPKVGEVFRHSFIKYIFCLCLSFFSSYNSCTVNVIILDVVPEVP